MTNNDSISTSTSTPASLGRRLKSAREGLGIDIKEAATQLRLNEKIILMMEEESFTSDLPVTFIRGYFRSYGKLLQIPETEILEAIKPIQLAPTTLSLSPIHSPGTPLTSDNYFMQILTYVIVFTLISLVGAWWYTHSSSPSTEPVAALSVGTTQTEAAIVPSTSTPANPATPPAIVNSVINPASSATAGTTNGAPLNHALAETNASGSRATETTASNATSAPTQPASNASSDNDEADSAADASDSDSDTSSTNSDNTNYSSDSNAPGD